MPNTSKRQPSPELGRKSAYVLRNRAAILRASAEVLAAGGRGATVEEIAQHAEVAVSTIYKHFKDKDALVSATLLAVQTEWLSNVVATSEQSPDPFEQLVIPMRFFVRLPQTNPHLARLLLNFFDVATTMLQDFFSGLLTRIETMEKTGLLKVEKTEVVIRNLFAVLSVAVIYQLNNPESTIEEADDAVCAALGMLGISTAKAKKLVALPMPTLVLASR